MAKHNASVVVAILLTAFSLAFNGLAEPVSLSLAARAVNTLISQGDQMECPIDGVVSSVRRCTATNGAAFYVAKLTGGGFVVTSADTEIDPIIAISPEADLVEDSNNPLWVLLTSDMAARKDDLAVSSKARTKLMRAGASGAASLSDAAARWANLTAPAAAASPASGAKRLSAGAGGGSNSGKSKISDVRVAPLLKTKWGQSYVAGKPCFNYYTPGQSVCGCTATACAQLFRYHKFPTEPVVPHTFQREVEYVFYQRNGYYVSRTQEFLTQFGGIYNWDNMPYVPSRKMTTAQRKAIGKLTYDVGLAVNESYSLNLTSGYLSRVVDLCHEWGYAHATDFHEYDYATDITKTHLKSVLIPNLDAKLPVGVRIYGKKVGGHFVVADGYGYLDNLFSVHLNFGWDGGSDAWYVLPGKTASGYTGLDELCGNVYPHGPKRGGIVSGRVLNASTKKPVSGIVVTATNGVGKVLRATTNAKGIYSFILPASEDNEYFPGDGAYEDDMGGGAGTSTHFTSTPSGGDWDDGWDDDWDDGWDDDWDDDWNDDDWDYELPYDSRNHLSFGDIDGGYGYDDGYWDDDDNWVAYDNWVIILENSSPASHPLYIRDGRNYYDQNFSVRIYTVKFDANGGSGTASRKCNVLGTLPTPKRTGYTFEGWFTAPNGGERVTETTEPTGNTTYYAHWMANPYTVEFDANGGNGSMAPMAFVYDDAQALRMNAFVKGDALFHGWSLSPRGLVAFADGEQVNNLTTISNGMVTLYAVWYGDVAAAETGSYIKAPLSVLGYDVPTDGKTPYEVKEYGLPAGLKLKFNAAVKDKKGKVVRKAKVEWWIEGVPTAAVDFATKPAYLVMTVGGKSETVPLYLETLAQDVEDLGELPLGEPMNSKSWLNGVGSGWSVSGLPTGLKFATKKVTKKSGSKTVTVAEAYAVYGKTTKAGLFTITAKKKVGAFYETKKYRVLVTPKAVDEAVFGDELADINSMAYDEADWNLLEGGHVGRLSLPALGTIDKVAGLPTGLAFAAKDIYAYANAKKKTGKYLKQKVQTILGTPTKPGTYVVTFTRNVKSGKNIVAKTAQIIWTVTQNTEPLVLGFNTAGGVIEGGTVGLKYGDLMAFSATDGATVTASGMPAGITLANLGDGSYAFRGFTTKAGTYLVTVKATLNGKTVTQRVALKVDGLPSWAKGTFNGYIADEDGATNGLATITVSSVGKISGKFQEGGTNWTFTAASYTGYDNAAPAYSVPVVAKYSYKEKEKVKVNGKWTTKTVAKYVTRDFTLRVGQDALGGMATLEEVDGSTAEAWQNLWGRADYKALAKELFSTKSGKKTLAYKMFAYEVCTNETGKVYFKDSDGVVWDGGRGATALPGEAEGLTRFAALSLKVTTAGAVTATLTYDTGKTAKDKKTKKAVPVYYKPTCATVVIPTTAADAYQFLSGAYLFFAPSAANNFPGVGGWVQVTDHDKVQLWEGGPYWATTNIGAERPEDYGLYFWWGDTTGYRPSSSGTFDFDFSYDNPAIYTYGKSMSELQEAGWMTSGGVLAPEHDAAHVHWGGSWRMPTDQEQQGLVDNCEWSPATMNGVDGYIVRGRGDYDSASIFLPCAGYSTWLSLWHAGSYGSCWSSVPYLGDSRYALSLNFRSGSHDTGYDFRYHGQPVRPVQGFTE